MTKLARDLIGDSTFDGLLDRWQQDGRCPLVLVDYLLDNGLERQAEAMKWVVNARPRSSLFDPYWPDPRFHVCPKKTSRWRTTEQWWYWSRLSKVSKTNNGGNYWELPFAVYAKVKTFADVRRKRYHDYFSTWSLAVVGLIDGAALYEKKLPVL